jgi:hypothetical protein
MTQTLEERYQNQKNKHFQAGWQAALDFMKNREKKINNSVSGKEDVKLPEVGKKYRADFDNMLEAEIEYISKNKEVVMSKLVNVGTKITVDENKIHSMDKFIKYFVELPEDTKEERFARVKDLMGKGQIFLPKEPDIIKDEIPKSDMADALAYVLNSKPKSIWKDVSELPKDWCDVIIVLKYNDIVEYGKFSRNQFRSNNLSEIPFDEIKQYCTLTDYINNTENFQKEVLERLRKLEGK